MNPITHGLISWCIAQPACASRRDAALVTAAGLVPDLDGAGALVDMWRGSTETADSLFGAWHHVAGHNIGLGIGLTLGVLALARNRLRTAVLAFGVFHLHLVCDLIGARGPDGYDWPIPYLLPFSDRLNLTWSGQWEINAWPNFVVTIVVLILAFRLAWKQGFSPLWYVSAAADAALIGTLRNRFPMQPLPAPRNGMALPMMLVLLTVMAPLVFGAMRYSSSDYDEGGMQPLPGGWRLPSDQNDTPQAPGPPDSTKARYSGSCS